MWKLLPVLLLFLAAIPILGDDEGQIVASLRGRKISARPSNGTTWIEIPEIANWDDSVAKRIAKLPQRVSLTIHTVTFFLSIEEVSRVPNVTEVKFGEFALTFGQLHQAGIVDQRDHTIGLGKKLEKHFPRIEHLDVSTLRFENEDLKEIGERLPAIKHLSCQGILFEEDILEILRPFKNLDQLSMTGSLSTTHSGKTPRIIQDDLGIRHISLGFGSSIQEIDVLSKQHSLRVLDISRCRFDNGTCFRYLKELRLDELWLPEIGELMIGSEVESDIEDVLDEVLIVPHDLGLNELLDIHPPKKLFTLRYNLSPEGKKRIEMAWPDCEIDTESASYIR